MTDPQVQQDLIARDIQLNITRMTSRTTKTFLSIPLSVYEDQIGQIVTAHLHMTVEDKTNFIDQFVAGIMTMPNPVYREGSELPERLPYTTWTPQELHVLFSKKLLRENRSVSGVWEYNGEQFKIIQLPPLNSDQYELIKKLREGYEKPHFLLVYMIEELTDMMVQV